MVDDLVALYFRDIREEPLLTAEEEVALAGRVLSGWEARRSFVRGVVLSAGERAKLEAAVREGEDARWQLARANTRLVVHIARRYRDLGLPLADLIQEGNLGLLRAVDKFDPSQGHRFSTYAGYWIWQAITRALSQKVHTIRAPGHVVERRRRLSRLTRDLENELGRSPTPEELAARMKLPLAGVRELLEEGPSTVSLEQPVGEDGSELGDFLVDQEAPGPEAEVERRLLEESVEAVLAGLGGREEQILRLRFGLDGGRAHTLQEVGDRLGFTREWIRQLERRALDRLRDSDQAADLEDYL